MGQYFMLVNVDREEYVDPHNIGLGLKPHEQLIPEASLSDMMYILLLTSDDCDIIDGNEAEKVLGRWCGDRVLIVGSYADVDSSQSVDETNVLYKEAQDKFREISDLLIPVIEQNFNIRIDTGSDGWRKRFSIKGVNTEFIPPAIAPDLVITSKRKNNIETFEELTSQLNEYTDFDSVVNTILKIVSKEYK